MTSATTLLATVEPNHTIKVPATLSVGEQVLIVRIPSFMALFNDEERRARFATTREAVQHALETQSAKQSPSNEEIVRLVKRARQATSNRPPAERVALGRLPEGADARGESPAGA